MFKCICTEHPDWSAVKGVGTLIFVNAFCIQCLRCSYFSIVAYITRLSLKYYLCAILNWKFALAV